MSIIHAMQHIALVVFIFAVSLGSFSIIYTRRINKHYQHAYLHKFFISLIMSNIILVLDNLYAYFNLNISPLVSASTRGWYLTFDSLIGYIPMYFFYFSVINFFLLIEGKRITKPFLWIYNSIWAVTLIAFIVVINPFFPENIQPVSSYFNFIIRMIGRLSILYFLITLVRFGNAQPKKKHKAIDMLAWYYLMLPVWILLLQTLVQLKILPESFFPVFIPLIYCYLNSIPLLYLEKFVLAYSGPKASITAGFQQEQLEMYGLTLREQEITVLICDGKCNKEISDILCISLQTVKDYTSKIYKKTKTHSRIQLSNLLQK